MTGPGSEGGWVWRLEDSTEMILIGVSSQWIGFMIWGMPMLCLVSERVREAVGTTTGIRVRTQTQTKSHTIANHVCESTGTWLSCCRYRHLVLRMPCSSSAVFPLRLFNMCANSTPETESLNGVHQNTYQRRTIEYIYIRTQNVLLTSNIVHCNAHCNQHQ